MNNNITSSNATAILTVDKLFPAGIILEQFQTDQAIVMEELVFSESRMGVDGKMASGFVPSIKTLTISLEASSPALTSLGQLGEIMHQNRTVYDCSLVVQIPSIGKVYTYSGGVLKSGKVFTDLKKVLEPVSFKFEFANFKSSEL